MKLARKLQRLPVMLVAAALVVFAALTLGSPATGQAQDSAPVDITDYRATMFFMIDQFRDPDITDRTQVFRDITEAGDALYIAPMLDLIRFTRDQELQRVLYESLATLSGADVPPVWAEWLNWAAANDIATPPDYGVWKGYLFSQLIDPQFQRFFPEGVDDTAQINMLEVVWGGVSVDGIPSLVNARQITPEEATVEGETFAISDPRLGGAVDFCRGDDCSYPAADELVFGVYVDGDARAYPLRLLNWHEMFNDVLGHAPLYDAPDGEVVCNFRAPVNFNAIAQQDGAWVQITGDSPGCPEEGGWLADPETLLWPGRIGGWEAVAELLPGPDAPLDAADAITGQVDGTPVMLAYCTLCGAGILYDPTIPADLIDPEAEGDATLEFGSTGLLMRSNKLMYDRTTDTVWNALTGEPAFGPLAGTDVQLDILPVVVTDWASWLEEHPDTSVLSLDTGFTRNYTNGAAYTDYFNDPEFIMFPVFDQDESVNENKEIVFALVIEDTPKAYPLRLLIPEQVTNDTIGGTNLVIVSRATPERDFFEPGGASVRAYLRGEYTFAPGETPREVIDQDGGVWQVTETALVGPDGETLDRLGGHLAFWFGWHAFYTDTLVYQDADMGAGADDAAGE